MSDSTKSSIKFRINNIYRNHMVLNYYSSKLLRNSLPTEENLKKLNDTKISIINKTESSVTILSSITGRRFEVIDYIDPLKVCADILTSEHFFDSQEIISDILKIYENNLNRFIREYQISPIDQAKLSRIDFI